MFAPGYYFRKIKDLYLNLLNYFFFMILSFELKSLGGKGWGISWL